MLQTGIGFEALRGVVSCPGGVWARDRVSSPDPTHYGEMTLEGFQQARDLHVRMRLYACIDILSECTETSLLCMSV